MNKLLKSIFALFLFTCVVQAQTGQTIKQSGNVTPGHAPVWVTNGIVKDGGTPALGYLTGLGVTTNGIGYCQNTAYPPAPYEQLCWGVNSNGVATISLNGIGAGAPLGSLLLNLNGQNYSFPYTVGGITGPNSSTVGHFALWNNTVGSLLADAATVSSNIISFTQAGTGAATSTVQTKERQIINVADFSGVDPTGASDSSVGIQAAVTAASSVSTLHFNCGTFLIKTQTVNLPSGTRIEGSGPCTIILADPALPLNSAWGALWPAAPTHLVFANSDFTSGNTDITISNIAFDLTNPPTSNATHAVMMYKASDVLIDSIECYGNGIHGGDCTAMVQTSRYIVRNSNATNMNNVCFDNWQSSSFGQITGNYCNGSATTTGGIVVTGCANGTTPGTTHDIIVSNNRIFNITDNAIWIQGCPNGFVNDTIVTGNTIDTVTAFDGIRISESARITASYNQIRNTYTAAIVTLEESTSACADCIIVGNEISATNQGGSSDPAVGAGLLLGPHTTNSIVAENRINGSNSYQISLSPGASGNQILGNLINSGNLGRIYNAGANNVIVDCNNANNCTSNSVWQVGIPSTPLATWPMLGYSNVQTYPASGFGFAIGNNFSNGGSEVDIFNNATSATNTLRVYQKTGASTASLVAIITPNGDYYNPGHFLNTSSAPGASSCGTSPSIASGSSNQGGQFTTGTGTPTACTVTFNAAYPTTAFCVVHPANAAAVGISGGTYISASSKTAFTITMGAGTSSAAFNYACNGN